MERSSSAFVALLISLITLPLGCAGSAANNDLAAHASPPTQEAQHEPNGQNVLSIAAALHAVLELPTVSGHQKVQDAHAGSGAGSVETLEIPSMTPLATDVERYQLESHAGTGLVYIVKSGGIAGHVHRMLGPWTADDPNVTRLVSLLTDHDRVAQQHLSD